MGKHLIKANTLTAETDKISAERRLQYTEVWNFDPLDLVTRQWVEEAVSGTNGFILNQDEDVQPAVFRISGTGEASAFKMGAFTINDDTTSMNHMLWSSGVYSYAGLSIASGTQFNIGAFNGFVVDNTTPNNPIITEVNYAGSVNNTTPFLLTNPATFVTSDKFGVITLSPNEPSEAFLRANILLGAVAHPAGVITSVSSKTDVLMGAMDQVADMFRPIKYINEGVTAFPNGVNLALANTGGRLYGLGIGFVTNGKDVPNSLAISAGAPTTFQYRTQTGVGSADTTLIVPGSYDVAGTVTPVGGGAGASTNQRVYLSETGVIRVQWGQQVYATLAEAISGASNEPFTIFSNNRLFGILIAIISINKSCTNLADTSTCRILSVSKFGEAVGGSAGISTGSLQTAYNNSVNPEIATNSINGGVTIRRGSASDTDNVFEVQNGAGTLTSRIDGNGLIVGNSILSTTTVRATTNSIADVSFLVGTGNGTQGGNNNLIKPFNATGFLNLKGGAGRAKIVISDDLLSIVSGANAITFNGNAASDVSMGNEFARMFASGNWVFGGVTDNGFKLEVVGTTRLAGDTTIGTSTATANLSIRGPVGSQRTLTFRTAGGGRWSIQANNIPEGGSNAGSDFVMTRFDDAGAFVSNVLYVKRSTGFFGFGNNVSNPLSQVHVDGTLTVTNPPGSEAMRIVNDSGFIAFYNTANSVRSGFIQGGSNDLNISWENGSKNILLNPTSTGFVGIQVNNPQAKLHVGSDHTPGTGEATFRGYIQINHATAQNMNTHGGLEFKVDAGGAGYGKRIYTSFDGAGNYDLAFQSRTSNATWEVHMIMQAAADRSRLLVLKNSVLSNNLYSQSNLEVRSDSSSVVSIGFHRAGASAVALYHLDSNVNNLLRIRDAGGGDYTVWHSGNLSPVAGSGTLDQVLTNGNISNPPSRFAIIGRIAIGKSANGYGTIGENYVTTGSDLVYNYFTTEFATQIDFLQGNINLKTAPSGTAGNPITFTSRLFVRNSDGNVGIGTTNPQSRLEVNGFSSFYGARNAIILNNSTGPANKSSIIAFQSTGTSLWQLGSDLQANGTQSFYLHNDAASTFPLYINASSNVGINQTNPLGMLHVHGGGANGAIVVTGFSEVIRVNDDGAYMAFWNSAQSARTGYLQMQSVGRIVLSSEQGNNYICLNPDNAGNVGIGTNSPSARLHVAGNAQCNNDFTVRSDSANNSIVINSAPAIALIQSVEASSGNPKDLHINSLGGNIGVGLALGVNPSDKLHVIGNVRATEFIRTSSIANKTNVEDYTDSALSILLDTKIRTYEKIDTGEFGIGFIAEDTHEILSGEKHDVHNFGAHLALLTKAIQELQAEIERLKKN